MVERTYRTSCGEIHYWKNELPPGDLPTIVFLPGLTADHRLFDEQVAYFSDKYSLLVWDAPGHGASWPFTFDFDLKDKATWLHEILVAEGIENPVIVGQSMGGYVGQAFAQWFPGELKGFVAIDSDPIKREYMTLFDLWLLKRMEPFYRMTPWKLLVARGAAGVATTKAGRSKMRDMMMAYAEDPARYAKLAGHGFRILAEAVEADLPYELNCPALLLCGEKDRAGLCKRYNKAWHKKAGIPLVWIPNAGHNANTDDPKMVNLLLEDFLEACSLTE